MIDDTAHVVVVVVRSDSRRHSMDRVRRKACDNIHVCVFLSSLTGFVLHRFSNIHVCVFISMFLCPL